MDNANHIVFHSVISSIQKVALYESKTVRQLFLPNQNFPDIVIENNVGVVFSNCRSCI